MAEPENRKNVTIIKLGLYAMPQQSEDQEMQNKNAGTLNLKIESWMKVKSKKVGPDFKSGNHMNLLKIGSPRPYERFGDNLDSLRKGRLLI